MTKTANREFDLLSLCTQVARQTDSPRVQNTAYPDDQDWHILGCTGNYEKMPVHMTGLYFNKYSL